MTDLLRCAQACGVKSLAYEGLEVIFHATGAPEAADPTYPPEWRQPGDEYVIARPREEPKKTQVIQPEVSEVVNLSKDYDRWEQFEAPPPTEDER